MASAMNERMSALSSSDFVVDLREPCPSLDAIEIMRGCLWNSALPKVYWS